MIDHLKKTRLFHDCTERELEEVASHAEQVTFQTDEQIFAGQSAAEHLYIVLSGAVELRFTVTHLLVSKEIALDRITEYRALGWSALTAPHLYTLSAVATRETTLLRIHRNALQKICEKENHFGYALMKNLAEIIGERFVLIQKILIDLIQQNIKEKEI